jgi:hypothetical protein
VVFFLLFFLAFLLFLVGLGRNLTLGESRGRGRSLFVLLVRFVVCCALMKHRPKMVLK